MDAMRMKRIKAALLIAMVAISAAGVCYAQAPTDHLTQLVELSARRLVIGEQVALSKWESGGSVADAPREEKVIANAVKAGQAKGLDASVVSQFFRAQIEANKMVQYALLAEWRRAGRAPDHKPVDLRGTIRPELDELGAELIAELAQTKSVRAGASCRTDVANAVDDYVLAHKKDISAVERMALDRAMTGACPK
jgi:chorismate mutase